MNASEITNIIETEDRALLCDTVNGWQHRKPFKVNGQYCIRFRSFVYPIVNIYYLDDIVPVMVPGMTSVKQYRRLT